MKKLILLSFLITCTFIFDEVFIFAQIDMPSSINGQQETDDTLIDIAKESDVTLGNEALVGQEAMALLRDFKAQLEANPNRDIADRIEEIQNVLNKSTDMFCTADEDEINDKGDNLNLALDKVLDKYGEVADAPRAIRDELVEEEKELRQKIIKSIDNVLNSNGKCDDIAPRFKVAV